MRSMHWIALLTIPLGYIAGQAGWVVAECGRQPWAIRDMLPTMAAISKLDVSSVQTFATILVACRFLAGSHTRVLIVCAGR